MKAALLPHIPFGSCPCKWEEPLVSSCRIATAQQMKKRIDSAKILAIMLSFVVIMVVLDHIIILGMEKTKFFLNEA